MSEEVDIPIAVQLAATTTLLAELARRMEAMVVAFRYRPLQGLREEGR